MSQGLFELQTKEFRPRRAHTKSRDGCLGCKQRRKKCDEVRPQCTRCATSRQPCRYPSRNTAWVNLTAPAGPSLKSSSSYASLLSADETERVYFSTSSSDNEAWSPSPGPALAYNQHGGIYDRLDDMERELVGHYISSTSATIAFDDTDLYALQTGIPRLASRGWSLMRSILALAAVSKCHAIIKGNTLEPSARRTVFDLLSRAERYHGDALRGAQDDISIDGRLDMALANAPLMVLYSSASRSIRVRIAHAEDTKTDESDGSLPSDLVPHYPDWISLVRAAHSAYSGVFGNDQNAVTLEKAPEVVGPPPSIATSLAIAREDGPKIETKALLLPIISATAPAAMQKLRATLPVAEAVTSSGTLDQRFFSAFQALEVMSSTVATIQASSCTSASGAGASATTLLSESDDVAGAQVPSWLQKYLARVTMHESSSPLRRTITAFINRTPAEYLQLVLGLLGSDDCKTYVSGDTGTQRPLDRTEMFALDVFAHWLVLVLLLDGVWWLEGVGMWELGHVVALMKGQRGNHELGQDGDWWPETMYRLARQIR